jgi:hypothetical protein
MKKHYSLLLGLLVLAAAATYYISAQSIGGDTALNSKTWTWLNVDDTVGVPTTALFTPTTTSDFIVTGHMSVNQSTDNNACPQAEITYTDEFGDHTASPISLPGGGPTFVAGAAGSSITIHVLANTTVYVQAVESGQCGPSPSGSYNLVIGKIKINP